MNRTLHDLSALFRTPERIHLLSIVLRMPACTVQQIATKSGMSKGLVSQYLALLEREGLLARKDRSYSPVHSARAAAVKRLLNIEKVASAFPKPSWARGTGMYGSWADGTNTEESDLDLWILVKDRPASLAVAEIERAVSRDLSTEVHILLLDKDKMAGIRKNDEPFYRLFSCQSVTLEGDSPDAA